VRLTEDGEPVLTAQSAAKIEKSNQCKVSVMPESSGIEVIHQVLEEEIETGKSEDIRIPMPRFSFPL